MRQQLREIADVFRNEPIDYLELKEAIDSYKHLMEKVSRINVSDDTLRNDIHSDTGMALGTSWAAMCLDDVIRTRTFVRGLFNAIEQVKTKKEKVHVLYAGTGPYATLALPVLASFSEADIECTLLEINETSFASMQHVIKELGFENYVRAYVNDDATKYVLKDHADIILSETMQLALEKEQQVPIVLNLMKQASEDTILIPERIDVFAGLLKFEDGQPNPDKTKKLIPVIELNGDTGRSADIFDEKTVALTQTDLQEYTCLSLLTEIQVFGDEKIGFNQSGLTISKRLEYFEHLEKKDKTCTFRYIIDDFPRIEYSLS